MSTYTERNNLRRLRRHKAVQELLSTEKTYVHLMSNLVEHYVEKLRFNTSMISKDDYKILFPSDIHAILGLNQTFLQDLSKVIESQTYNDNTLIGNIIYAFCPHFKMYQNYLNNYSAAAERLAQLRRKSSSSFSIYCDRLREEKYFNHLPLESLIILPIQRMPRYKMLLEEIIKHTQRNHPDLQELKQALSKISEVNDSINNRMKDFEARIKVQNIENRFNGKMQNLVTPSRRFITQGQLCKIEIKDDEDFLFILFNDCLLYASQSMIGDKLIFGNLLHFNAQFKIQQTPHKINVHHINNLFEIHSTRESFMLYASTKKEMEDWINIIIKTCNEYMQHIKHLKTNETDKSFAVTLEIPNDFADKCMVNGCNSRFSFVNRRHHCKYCGFVVCGKCSANQLQSRISIEMVRVCDVCYKALSSRVRDHYDAIKSLGLNEEQTKTKPKREKELFKLYEKREKEAEDENINKKRESAVLDFVTLDIEPKLIAFETQNKKLQEEMTSLKQKVSSLQRTINDNKYAHKQIVNRLEKENDELRADNGRLQSLVHTLSITDESKKAEEVHSTKLKTLESHNNNLRNELTQKEQEIKQLLQQTHNDEEIKEDIIQAKRICSTCNKEIIGRALKTKSGIYHRSCHVCSECKAVLAGKLYGILERNGEKRKLCEICTNAANERIIQDSGKKQNVANKNNLFAQMNEFRSTATKVPKLWDVDTSSSPTLKPSVAATITKPTASMKKTQSVYKVKGVNPRKYVQKKKNSRSHTLMAQRKCNKCKAAIFGKNSISGPNNTIFHSKCFRCNDCNKELKAKQWRSYPVIGKNAKTLILCPDCARKRDEALFSQHRGKLKLNI